MYTLTRNRHRYKEYDTNDLPTDPVTASAASLVMDIGGIGMAIADMPRELFRAGKKAFNQTNLADSTEKTPHTQSGSNSTAPSLHKIPSITSTGATKQGSGLADSTSLLDRGNVSQNSHSETSSLDSTTLETAHSSVPGTSNPKTSRNQAKQASTRGDSPSMGLNLDAAMDAGRGVSRVVTTGAKTPMNFCLGVARGFRNMPRLYNDDTIRPVDKVTDFTTGVKVASKEFGLGLFDGISGLVTQPLRGAEKEGAGGLVKGFGKGIGGLMTKPAAGESILPDCAC